MLSLKTLARLLALLAAAPTSLHAAESSAPHYTGDIIVKWRESSDAAVQKARLAQRALRLEHKSALRADLEVLKPERPLEAADLAALIAELNARSDVEYAVAEQWRYAHAIPADALYPEQWYLMSTQYAATRMDQAWDLTTGDPGVIVAVLDSGVRFEHPDLGRVESGGKLLPGYDFISNAAVANDGGGRDADAADPGDWVTAEDLQQPPFNSGACEAAPSSWHGTRVASLVGAFTNNAEGMAASGYDTRVLPVRVLGKCGGSDGDIIAAMRWAAGLAVPGVPANATPAQIINMSLGADGVCSPAYVSAINEILARGVLIVSSAGNDGKPVNSPANCSGVLAVTAVRHVGTKVGYSNLGPEVGIAAPGGNCGGGLQNDPNACLYPILAATNQGETTPGASGYSAVGGINVGTSFAAPLVAGAAALMRAVDGHLTPAQLTRRLKESATPFPVDAALPTCRAPANADDVQQNECVCTTQTCGAGILNARAAVVSAQRPIAVLNAPASFDAASGALLDASGSQAANQRTIAGWQWTVVNVVGAAPVITAPNQAQTSIQVSGGSRFTLRLTVTDNQGAQDVAEQAMATTQPVNTATSAPNSAQASGGGGGGALDGAALCWLLVGCAALLLRRHQLARKIA